MPVRKKTIPKDIGVQAVDALFKRLMIEEEWSVRKPRGFTWWAHRVAQHVEAGRPSWDGEREACALRVWTDVAKDVDPTRAARVVGIANIQQTLNALVWDSRERAIAECCTVVVTDQNICWLGKILAWVAVLQNAAAHSRVRGVSASGGGVPAESNHPRNGERPEMDDILNVPAELIARAGKDESAFVGPCTEALGPFADQFGLLGFAGATGFTCEVPFTGSRRAMEMIATGGLAGPETALVRVSPDIQHPAFGSGVQLTLSLPMTFDKDQAPVIANHLNHTESKANTDTALLGAWCPDPSRDDGSVAFNAFVPNALAQPGLLENLVLYLAVRSRFAASVLSPCSAH